MPYGIFDVDGEFCVYKKNATGKRTGKALGCHASRGDAEAQLKALHVNEFSHQRRRVVVFENTRPDASVLSEFGGSLDDFVSAARDQFYSQYQYLRMDDSGLFWVSDVFADHIVARLNDTYYRVSFTTTKGAFTFAARGEWQEVALQYQPVREFADSPLRQSVEYTVVTEMAGKYPDVPVADGVDLALLTQGDPDPMFLTLQIATVGKTSANGLIHDTELANTIVQQINTDRPGGIMGHIKDEDRDSSFPLHEIHWIGAILENKNVWAKGYFPATRQEVREEYRITKAKGGMVATSIYGTAKRELVDELAGTWYAREFDLENLDLAPNKRAALGGTSNYYLTSELHGDSDGSDVIPEPAAELASDVEDTMDRDAIIAQLTVNDLPAALREQVISAHTASREQQDAAQALETATARIAELEAGATEAETLRQRVQELEQAEAQRVAEQAQAAYTAAVDAQVDEHLGWLEQADGAEAVFESLSEQLRTAVKALVSEQTVEQVAAVAEQAWARVKPLAELARNQISGGAALVGARKPTPVVDEFTHEKGQEARAEFGI